MKAQFYWLTGLYFLAELLDLEVEKEDMYDFQ